MKRILKGVILKFAATGGWLLWMCSVVSDADFEWFLRSLGFQESVKALRNLKK